MKATLFISRGAFHWTEHNTIYYNYIIVFIALAYLLSLCDITRGIIRLRTVYHCVGIMYTYIIMLHNTAPFASHEISTYDTDNATSVYIIFRLYINVSTYTFI